MNYRIQFSGLTRPGSAQVVILLLFFLAARAGLGLYKCVSYMPVGLCTSCRSDWVVHRECVSARRHGSFSKVSPAMMRINFPTSPSRDPAHQISPCFQPSAARWPQALCRATIATGTSCRLLRFGEIGYESRFGDRDGSNQKQCGTTLQAANVERCCHSNIGYADDGVHCQSRPELKGRAARFNHRGGQISKDRRLVERLGKRGTRAKGRTKGCPASVRLEAGGERTTREHV